jgi:hypothetical protein
VDDLKEPRSQLEYSLLNTVEDPVSVATRQSLPMNIHKQDYHCTRMNYPPLKK